MIRPGDDVLADLAAWSATLGADPAVIQGPGGNTSVKVGAGLCQVLHVKASGLWLRHAAVRPSFVALDLGRLRTALAGAIVEPSLQPFILDAPGGMRPSIETSLHAAMPHPVVVHTHSVNAIAHLVQPALEATLAAKLAGLRWAYVPYARPGLPLLRAVEHAGGAKADVLMLANHGLVLGAGSVAQAAALHADLEARLRLPVRWPVRWPAGSPDLAPDLARLRALGGPVGWRPAALAESHQLGLDPISAGLSRHGALYPDHVVFLGAGPVLHCLATDEAGRSGRKLLVVGGAGALVPEHLDDAAEEMVRGLSLVLARIGPGASLRTLTATAERDLTEWDAEVFRRSLARASSWP